MINNINFNVCQNNGRCITMDLINMFIKELNVTLFKYDTVKYCVCFAKLALVQIPMYK